jgi:hypothetical protein
MDFNELSLPIDFGTANLIQSLLHNSSLSEQRKCTIENELHDMLEAEAWKIIKELEQSQLNPITHGSHYNQTQIKNELKNLQ